MNKLLIPTGMLLAAIVLLTAGFLADNQDAFIFPNVVSATMVALALLTILFANKESNKEKKSKPIPWLSILPALIIFVIYLTSLEVVGFYLSSLVAFIAIVVCYHSEKTDLKNMGKIVFIGLFFMSALYCLFTLLLRVQLPRGFFF